MDTQLHLWAETPAQSAEPSENQRLKWRQQRDKINAWRRHHRQSQEVRARERAADKEFRRKHKPWQKPKARAYMAEYYLRRKTELLDAGKRYRQQNKELISQRRKALYSANREKKLQQMRASYRRTRAKRLEYMRRYDARLRSENLGTLREYQRRSRANEKLDPRRWLARAIRARIRVALKRHIKGIKAHHSSELLGCSYETLKQHLESQFKPGMTWQNYGFWGWHIDHIRPIDSFDVTKEEEQKRAFHYSNLQPLWREENLRKGAKSQPSKL